MAAGFTEALSPAVGQIEDEGFGSIIARTAVSAAIGGTASTLSGGSFANGAQTGAFQQLFNETAHGRMLKTTRDVETMYSDEGESFNDFVNRLGSRIFKLTQEQRVEFSARIGARLETVNGQQADVFGAIIQTQDAATWSAATRTPDGYSPVRFGSKVMTLQAHPATGKITRNDKLFSGGDASRLRIGNRAPGVHLISNVDQRAGALFLATPSGVLFYNGRNSRSFPTSK